MTNNIISEPRLPTDIKSKVYKLLSVLLDGNSVNRKNCSQFGIDEKNASIHSLVSYLRHRILVPIMTQREEHGIANYIMDAAEIIRFKSPHLRELQKQEMRSEIESKRKANLLKAIRMMVGEDQEKLFLDASFLDQVQQFLRK